MTVYLHVGAPKTGTTFLQELLAGNRRRLARAGLLYPGRETDHFEAALDLLGDDFHGVRAPRAGAWQKVAAEAAAWSGHAAVISHELLSIADDEHMDEVVATFPEGELEILYTARDLSRVLPAMWQESLKNRQGWPLGRYLRRAREAWEEAQRTGAPLRAPLEWFDLPNTLGRWARRIGPAKVHVVVLPRAGRPDALWHRVAPVLDVAPDIVRIPARSNESLGVVEAEFLRRLNRSEPLQDLGWPQYHRFVKHALSQRLVDRDRAPSRKILLPERHRAWVDEFAQHHALTLRESGYHLVGDPADLLPDPDAGPEPERASQKEVAAVAVEAAAILLREKAEHGGAVRRIGELVGPRAAALRSVLGNRGR